MGNKTYAFILGIMLAGALLASGCGGASSSATAEDGNTVKVHYTGTLDDGSVFDTSVGREPLEFTLGLGQMIAGFENAVRGMQVGQSKTVIIPADEAYGQYRDDLVLVVERSQLPQDREPEVGQQLYMQQPNGSTITVVITELTETTATLDANHRLAGKDLTFEIELIDIN